MSGKFLLDTNIVIALFADEVTIKSNLTQASEVFIPSIVIGELCYGARKSGRVGANLARINELVGSSTILVCDAETAQQYGEVKNNLRLKGRPLPENDIWIAALSLQHDLILVTRDAHFKEVENLQTVAW
jgi:tRNA(fMet)-specific endonuclease VapC